MATAERGDRGLWKKAAITVPVIVILGFVMGAVSNSVGRASTAARENRSATTAAG